MIKKFLSLSILLSFVAVAAGTAMEPGLIDAQATANDSGTVTLAVNEEITISNFITDNMVLGVAALEDTAEASWTVTTNSADGYSLVLTGTDPAMQNDGAGADIDDLPTTTPAAWDTTVSGAADGVYFGFSAFGDDVADGTFGAGSSCGAGTIPANLNYRGFDTGAGGSIVTTTGGPTVTAGVATTVCFAAEQKNEFAEDGDYTATVTATATAA